MATDKRGLWPAKEGGMPRTLITCSPLFPDLALNEIRRSHPDIAARQVAPGSLLLETPCTFGAFTKPWQSKLPIYLHHAFPIREHIALKSPADLAALKVTAARLAPDGCAIQLRSSFGWESPYSTPAIERALGVNSIPRAGGRVLSILVTPDGDGACAWLGVSCAAQNISPYAGGLIPAAECVPNRAGYKLLEALATFGLSLRRGNHALDLGAAPGAWTTLLRRRGLTVTAVAPAPMYPWLALDRGVTHQPVRAEEYLPSCDTVFDLIVNDMKLDGQESARVMVDYARHLKPGGVALMTLKLRSANMLRVMDHTLRLLRKAYRIVRVRNLVANRHEVTLLLERQLSAISCQQSATSN